MWGYHPLHPRNQIEGTKGEKGAGYRLQVVVRGEGCKQKWSMHIDQQELKYGVVDIKRCWDQIILIKMVFMDLVLNVISAYAPQVVYNEKTKMEFQKAWRTWLGVYLVERSS
jgi:hypothetical protein